MKMGCDKMHRPHKAYKSIIKALKNKQINKLNKIQGKNSFITNFYI